MVALRVDVVDGALPLGEPCPVQDFLTNVGVIVHCVALIEIHEVKVCVTVCPVDVLRAHHGLEQVRPGIQVGPTAELRESLVIQSQDDSEPKRIPV